MPTTKRPNKTAGKVFHQKPLPEQLKASFQQATNDLVALARQAKREFDRLDTATKRKVIAGLSGVAALLALRAHHRRKR